MASTRQIEANRRNGALGGPKTDAGKQSGKFHALQHGLCSESTVLPGESQQEFQKLRQDLFQHWLPENEQEKFEFEQLVVAAWRLVRVRGVETAMWSQYIVNFRQQAGVQPIPESPKEAHLSLAGVLCEVEDRTFNNYFRYERAIERSYYRALQQLQRTQSLARKAESQRAVDSQRSHSEPAAVSECGIRSVSHIAVAAASPGTVNAEPAATPEPSQAVIGSVSQMPATATLAAPHLESPGAQASECGIRSVSSPRSAGAETAA